MKVSDLAHNNFALWENPVREDPLELSQAAQIVHKPQEDTQDEKGTQIENQVM